MTRLDNWLKEATRCLSADSIARVRTEIQEHYDSALADALHRGAPNEEADRSAVMALGDARIANREFRQVLLTSAEARILRQGNWEARAVCSRRWLKRLFPGIPAAAALLGSLAMFRSGDLAAARMILAAGLVFGLLCAAPFLPIYTPMRARLFRYTKWVVFVGLLAFAFGPNALKWSWLWISCLSPIAWTELTRVSIRRKLPVAEWPKQLYL